MEPIKELLLEEESPVQGEVQDLIAKAADVMESRDPEELVNALLERADELNAPNLQQLADYLNISGDSELYAQLQARFPDLVENLHAHADELKETLSAFLGATSPEQGFAMLVERVPQLSLTLDPTWVEAISAAISDALQIPIPPELWEYIGSGDVGDAISRLAEFYEPVIKEYLLGILGEGALDAGESYLKKYLPQAAREAGTATYEAGLSTLLTLLYYAAPEETAKLVSSVSSTLNVGSTAGELVNSVTKRQYSLLQALGALAAGGTADQALGVDLLNALTTSSGGAGGAYFELPNGEKYYLTNVANKYILAVPHTSYFSFDPRATNKPGNDVIVLKLEGGGGNVGSMGKKMVKTLSKQDSDYLKAAGSAAKAYNQISSGMGSMSLFYDVAFPALVQALEWERQQPDNLRDLLVRAINSSASREHKQPSPELSAPTSGDSLPMDSVLSPAQDPIVGRDALTPEGGQVTTPVSPLDSTDPGSFPSALAPAGAGQEGSSSVGRVSSEAGLAALVGAAEHKGTPKGPGRFGTPVPR